MRRLALASLVMMVVFGSPAGAATQWKIGDGGTGNFFEQIVTPGVSRDWAASKADAEAMALMGVSGHLVTITSPEEQLFVQKNSFLLKASMMAE